MYTTLLSIPALPDLTQEASCLALVLAMARIKDKGPGLVIQMNGSRDILITQAVKGSNTSPGKPPSLAISPIRVSPQAIIAVTHCSTSVTTVSLCPTFRRGPCPLYRIILSLARTLALCQHSRGVAASKMLYRHPRLETPWRCPSTLTLGTTYASS